MRIESQTGWYKIGMVRIGEEKENRDIPADFMGISAGLHHSLLVQAIMRDEPALEADISISRCRI